MGFDSAICAGCPRHDTDGDLDRCDLCGCPTEPGTGLDRAQQPPQGCPRMDAHARSASRRSGGLGRLADSLLDRRR